MTQVVARRRALLAALVLLAPVADAHAAAWRVLPQRRGGRFLMPAKPANVDSSATVDSLKKALNALGSTNYEYDGHRGRAIAHVGAAIRHLELPNARGKNDAAVDRAATGKAAAETKTAATADTASDEALRKAKSTLFAVHHKLKDHTATRGHVRADAEVRVAIDEIVAALKLSTASPAAGGAAATSAGPSAVTAGPGRTAR